MQGKHQHGYVAQNGIDLPLLAPSSPTHEHASKHRLRPGNMVAAGEFPARYEPLDRLGKGGGGEVWSARDRITGEIVALKLLRAEADEAEMLALVREATVLSGIEGLGVPRVLHFGRLPKTDRAYMVRELVEGHSLSDLLPRDKDSSSQSASVPSSLSPAKLLSAVAQSADLLTRLHRSLLLHGDIKPANIIVAPDGCHAGRSGARRTLAGGRRQARGAHAPLRRTRAVLRCPPHASR